MEQTQASVKPDRRAARYAKLCATIERWQRRVDKADRIVQRGTRTLIKLERQRRRAQAAMAKAKAEPAPATEHPRVEAKQGAVADSLVVSAAVDAAPPAKPKRQRAPKRQPEPNGSGSAPPDAERLTGRWFPPAASEPKAHVAAVVDKTLSRTARMKALGFRPTKGK